MIKQAIAHQQNMHGYNADELKNWSPQTDKNAKYFRSRVPLAKRIPSFSATQASPKLSAQPQVMNLSADYDKETTGFKYGDSFCRNHSNFGNIPIFMARGRGYLLKVLLLLNLYMASLIYPIQPIPMQPIEMGY